MNEVGIPWPSKLLGAGRTARSLELWADERNRVRQSARQPKRANAEDRQGARPISPAAYWIQVVWIEVRGTLALIIDLLSSGLGWTVTALESSLGWVLNLGSVPIELGFAIPLVGRLILWLWCLVLSVVWGILALPDGLLTLVGVMPEKRLRVSVYLPTRSDGTSLGGDDDWAKALRQAAVILRNEANVRLSLSAPFEFRSAFSPVENPDRKWLRRADSGPWRGALRVGCLARALWEDLAWKGSAFHILTLRYGMFGLFRRLTGFGAPVSVIAVAEVHEGRLAGCSLGPLTDYVTLLSSNPVCLVHELGHACNLWHIRRPGNLMNPACGGRHLRRWQAALLRMSRHVSYV